VVRGPRVGQKVRLNDEGLDFIFGGTAGLSLLKTVVHTVTLVEPLFGSKPGVCTVEVADRELNQFLLTNEFFDEV
jgi:hypothetical protein